VLGELVQMTARSMPGSKSEAPMHPTGVHRRCTGQLGELWFVPDETFFAYCEATRHYLERFGKPVAFYSDQHGIFRSISHVLGSTSGLTQFGRACRSLISRSSAPPPPRPKDASNAPTKPYKTLVKELRLRGISICRLANA